MQMKLAEVVYDVREFVTIIVMLAAERVGDLARK